MEKEFKLNDRVFHIDYGWGVIIKINEQVKAYPILVSFTFDQIHFSSDGRMYSGSTPSLSHNEYSIN
jgi:hypothetical protein